MSVPIEPPPPGLEALLQALRAVGLPLGAREVLRLHHVFALAPALAQERPSDGQLRDLLASALVHDPGERELFEQVFEPWAERWTQWERRARPAGHAAEPVPTAPETKERQSWAWVNEEEPTPEPTRSRRRLAVLLLALALALLRPDVVKEPTKRVTPPAVEPAEHDTFHILSPEPPTTFTEWVPTLEVVRTADHQQRQEAWPLLGFGVLALLVAGGLGWRYARKPWLPEVLPDPKPGPAKLPLLPPAVAGPELLDAEGVRTLVWGVGRHVSEELTADLDLEATVGVTARAGGLPELRYAPEKRLREVWLWLDGTTGEETMERWADEVAASLAGSGLPVRVGGFDGYPEELLWEEGQLFRPQEVEVHRQTALVAVCTDGAVLARHLEDQRGPAVRALLRALAAWPHLAFVDFSNSGELAVELGPLRVPCVAPDDLPAFFGLETVPVRARPEVDPGELRAWRAALALGGRPVDRASAYALRRELGLELSPWTFHLLREGDDGGPTVPRNVGGHLAWSEEGRTALVAWLAETSFREPTGVREGSLLSRALDFWERRLAGEAEERGKRGPLDPWHDRPAERHLRMERALLRLWRRPSEGAEELFELRAGELGDEIRGRLASLAPRDCTTPDDGRAPLPWRLSDEGDRTRYLLAQLGLGGLSSGDLRRPGRLGLGLGLLASLGLGLIGVGLQDLARPLSGPEPEIVSAGVEPAADVYAFADKKSLDSGRWIVYAGTPRGPLATLEVDPGAKIQLAWSEGGDRPCIDGPAEAQLWRCGSIPRQATTRDVGSWPRRSFAVLAFPAAGEAARKLAVALIDSGSADAVLLGRDAATRLSEVLGSPSAGQDLDQLLYIRPGESSAELPARLSGLVGSYAALTAADPDRPRDQLAAMDGIFPIDRVWASWLDEPKTEVQAMLSYCPWQEAEQQPSGMLFVRICDGTFRMGSEDKDPQAYDDEKPAHEVKVRGFWMGQKEVTNAQFRGPTRGEDHEFPATTMTWFVARDYCRSLGSPSSEWVYDLPTEAEWEYAARAGTTTAWSSGDDESQLKDYAWFAEKLGSGEAHPVGRLKPNPWGLYDMHGNVWEWVLDCWVEEAYRKRAGDQPVADPALDSDSCHETDEARSAPRVLRGGSAWDVPGVLRSAFRSRDDPEDRFEFIGFRCVRRPRRQP